MQSSFISKIHHSSLIAQDYYLKSHGRAAMSVALLSEKLRNVQGVEADAIRLTCVHSGKVILLVLLDAKPGEVSISIGDKEDGDAEFIEAVDANAVDSEFILKLIEANMSKEPK